MWPPCISLDDLSSIFEVEEIINSMSNRKAAGPDELPAQLPTLILDEDRYGNRHKPGRGRAAGTEICHDHGVAKVEEPDGAW